MSDVMDRLRLERLARLGRLDNARQAASKHHQAKVSCPNCGQPWLLRDTHCGLCGEARAR